MPVGYSNEEWNDKRFMAVVRLLAKLSFAGGEGRTETQAIYMTRSLIETGWLRKRPAVKAV